MLKNSLRLAHVWMDKYKDYYLKHEKVPKDYNFGDISSRLELRQRLHCQDFAWYLKNVYPELRLPGEESKKSESAPIFQPWHSRKRNYLDSFQLRLSGTQLCAAVVSPKVKGFWKKGSSLTLQLCRPRAPNQTWYETEKSEIILDKLLCLEAASDALVVINKCHEMMGDQQWRHTRNADSPVYNMAKGTCLRAAASEVGAVISLDLCSKASGVGGAWDIVLIEQAGKNQLQPKPDKQL